MKEVEFLRRAKEKHGAKFDYSKTHYVNDIVPIVVTCVIHGDIHIRPHVHLNSKTGCQKCSGKHRPSVAEVIQRAAEVHCGKYDYSLVTEYKNQKTKLDVICPTHGMFKVTAANHINGNVGCPECAKMVYGAYHKHSDQTIIEEAIKVHGDVYDYSLVKYQRIHDKVQIICKKHGVFDQTMAGHVKGGHGCPKCKSDKLVGGYGIQRFLRNPLLQDQPGILYVVSMLDQNTQERFIKVGITKHDIGKRFTGQTGNYVITLHTTLLGTMYTLFHIEQTIKKQFSTNKYRPCHEFKGHTECFTFESLNAIMNYVDELQASHKGG